MNSGRDRYNTSDGCYIGNSPMHRNYSPSYLTSNPNNIHFRHSYSPCTAENIHFQEIKDTNTINQRHLYTMSRQQERQQQQQQQLNFAQENCEKRGSSSLTTYYNRIHTQIRSNTPICQHGNPTLSSQTCKETSPFLANNQVQYNFLPKPAYTSFRTPLSKVDE